ncbi:MAG: hypothetical protein H6508_07170 [Calditrichaeota bacterium]|nr:hypothetical protein [Calditrichota bacterium]MCB9366940.1 hypothetical protein [Calditrichota bacterium]
MMLFWTYWLLAALIGALAVRELYAEGDWRRKLSAAIVLIPILLRVLLLK